MAEVWGGCCYKSCSPAAVAHWRLENAHLGTAVDTRSPAAGGAGMGLQERNIPQFYMAWYVFWSTYCSSILTCIHRDNDDIRLVGFIETWTDESWRKLSSFHHKKSFHGHTRLSVIPVALAVNASKINRLRFYSAFNATLPLTGDVDANVHNKRDSY